MRMQLIIRFGYGLIVPWVRRVPDGVVAQAGPDALHLSTAVELRGENLTTVAEFAVQEGSTERFGLSWFPSYELPAAPKTLTRLWPAPRRGGGSGRSGAPTEVSTAMRS